MPRHQIEVVHREHVLYKARWPKLIASGWKATRNSTGLAPKTRQLVLRKMASSMASICGCADEGQLQGSMATAAYTVVRLLTRMVPFLHEALARHHLARRTRTLGHAAGAGEPGGAGDLVGSLDTIGSRKPVAAARWRSGGLAEARAPSYASDALGSSIWIHVAMEVLHGGKDRSKTRLI